MEEYKLGRAVTEAIQEELRDREMDDICLMEEPERRVILYIEDGKGKFV